ncbi:MAG TPA: DUF2577 family protein [Clostridiales bacterium]|nr:DUF2577 family protein [Clostridiales bacterium]
MIDSQDNPYSGMLNLIREDSGERYVAPWCFGIIRSLSPPAVEINGQVVSYGVFINSGLLPRTASFANLLGNLEGTPEDMSILAGSLTGTLSGPVAIGDRVVLLQSQDGQEYVVLCKVV